MKTLSTIWADVRTGKNLDIYLTLAIAIAVAVLGVAGVANQQVLSSALLATLALISAGLLVSRHQNQQIQIALDRMQNSEGLSNRFLKARFDRSILPQYLRHARTVFFWGFSFTSTIPSLRDEIDDGLRGGMEIRFLLVQPASAAISTLTVVRSEDSVEELNESIARNLAQLARHARKYERDGLHVKLIDHLPPYTLIVIDPQLPTGRMFVRLSDFSVPRDNSPWFELSREADKTWFDFFLRQYELVWDAGKEYPLRQGD